MCFICTQATGFETDIESIIGISEAPKIAINEFITPEATTASNENKYTFNIIGLNQTSSIYDGIYLNSIKGIEYLSSKFKWKGTLDFVVKFIDKYPDAWGFGDNAKKSNVNGFASYGNYTEVNHEITTGNDRYTNKTGWDDTIYQLDYDLGSFVLAESNAEELYNYGKKIFIDPNPVAEIDSAIPTNQHDYFSIFIHESLHTLGMNSSFSGYKNLISESNGKSYFTGESAISLYGQNLELASNISHYSLTSEYDMMGGPRGYGLYEKNRWSITKLDQAIFGDLGLGIVLDGDNTNENYIGGLGDDIINTFGGEDVIKGRDGDDIINGGDGNDVIDGGTGSDTSVYSGKFSNYSFTRNTSSLEVEDQRTGSKDGADTLSNIEYIQFLDQTIEESKVDIVKTYSGNFSDYNFYNTGNGVYKIKTDSGYEDITGFPLLTFTGEATTSSFRDISAIVDIKGTFDQVTGLNTDDAKMFRLYNASFKRLPDPDGLNYWIGKYSSGENDERAVASSFLVSDEFKQRYGANVSDTTYLNNLYQNVLGRLPDSNGLNYWLGQLNSGAETRYEVLLGFAESAENKAIFTEMTGFG